MKIVRSMNRVELSLESRSRGQAELRSLPLLVGGYRLRCAMQNSITDMPRFVAGVSDRGLFEHREVEQVVAAGPGAAGLVEGDVGRRARALVVRWGQQVDADRAVAGDELRLMVLRWELAFTSTPAPALAEIRLLVRRLSGPPKATPAVAVDGCCVTTNFLAVFGLTTILADGTVKAPALVLKVMFMVWATL